MISRIIGKLTGERLISCEGEARTEFVNLIGQCDAPVYAVKYYGKAFSCRLTNRAAKRLFCECKARGIEVEMSPLLGLFGLLYRYRKRYGLFLGALLMALATFISRYFIWDMRVVGNEDVPASQIIAELEELGCAPGAYIPSLDFKMIANDYLLKSEDIAWISVNMRSSVANVEVLERKKPFTDVDPERRTGEGGANLIATEDAQIVRATITSGQRIVSPGDIVRQGELLAAGEITMRDGSVRYEYAFGEVLGKVYREINIEIPVEGEKKVYTGRENERKIVKIFGKSKNLFGNGGIEYSEYDKIYKEEQLSVFGSVTLPVTVITETDKEYLTEPCAYTQREVEQIAKREFRDELDALLSQGEIASIERNDSFDGEYFRIVGKIYLIKNVAQVSEPIPAEIIGDKGSDDTKNYND